MVFPGPGLVIRFPSGGWASRLVAGPVMVRVLLVRGVPKVLVINTFPDARMVLTPRLVGDRVGLHPVTVIFAVLAGGQLFGFLGILLALPVASALNVLVRHLHLKYTSSPLYNDEPEIIENPPEPETESH